jgi:hypothetical protein
MNASGREVSIFEYLVKITTPRVFPLSGGYMMLV